MLHRDSCTCVIDACAPLEVRRPGSVAEVEEIVADAADSGTAIYPVGGQTKLELGMPPTRSGVAVDMRSIDRIVDYPARDMTITLEGGTTIARLQALLRTENQRLPVDVPEAEQATLGGTIATNTSGPRRYGHGTLRDYVIGISTVNDGGKVAKAGGRVVKNVAGYDFCKLHVGALGTLGVITEATLKLRPLAEEEAVILFPAKSNELESILDSIHHSRARPVCVDLIDSVAAQEMRRLFGTTLPEAPWIVVIGFEGNQSAVTWQVQQSLRAVPGRCGSGVDVRVGAARAQFGKHWSTSKIEPTRRWFSRQACSRARPRFFASTPKPSQSIWQFRRTRAVALSWDSPARACPLKRGECCSPGGSSGRRWPRATRWSRAAPRRGRRRYRSGESHGQMRG